MEIKLSRYFFPSDENSPYIIGIELFNRFNSSQEFKINVREIIIKEDSYEVSKTPKVFTVKQVVKDLEAICLDENQNEVKLPLDRFYFRRI